MNSRSEILLRYFWIFGIIGIIFLFGLGFLIRQSITAEVEDQPAPTISPDPAIVSLQNPNEKRLIGIIENPSVPFSSMSVLIENAWQEKINDEYVTVFAGAMRADPDKGVLIIQAEGPLTSKFIYLPGAGSVKISDFKGNQLVLQSKNKGVFYYDVPGRTFIKALGEIIPTITPVPP